MEDRIKIFLVGMPGSGKTTLGKALAERLNIPFIDLDAEIEAQETKSISEIFREKGEKYFRESESRILKSFATNDQSFVLATGGGAPCYHNGMQTINQAGISVFLEVSLEELLERTKENNDRPLLGDGDRFERLKNLHEQRLPIYRQAKFTVNNLSSIKDSIESIIKKSFQQ